ALRLVEGVDALDGGGELGGVERLPGLERDLVANRALGDDVGSLHREAAEDGTLGDGEHDRRATRGAIHRARALNVGELAGREEVAYGALKHAKVQRIALRDSDVPKNGG